MASFNLFVSNQMEMLAEQLENTFRKTFSDPMQGDLGGPYGVSVINRL